MSSTLRKVIFALSIGALLTLVAVAAPVNASSLENANVSRHGLNEQDCTPRQVLYEMLVYAYGYTDSSDVQAGVVGEPVCVTEVQSSAPLSPLSTMDDALLRVTSGVFDSPPKF